MDTTSKLSKPTKFALCFRSSTGAGDDQFAIHAAGCSDLRNEEVKLAATIQEVDGPLSSALAELLDEQTREQGWSEEHVRIYPCCKTGAKEKKVDASLCAGVGQVLYNPHRRVYLPCPFCGKAIAALRGVVPRHKPYDSAK